MKEHQNKTRSPKKQNLSEESELWQWASERHKKALREYAEKEIFDHERTQKSTKEKMSTLLSKRFLPLWIRL